MQCLRLLGMRIDRGVRRVVALSTDKASSPAGLYGASKLVADKLFVAANLDAGSRDTLFSVVRYGNVLGSRGSVVPRFRSAAADGRIPLTDERMSRFCVTAERAAEVVFRALATMRGGEIFVPKVPSLRVADLARAIDARAEIETIGMRPGEKLHEEMIGEADVHRSFDCGDHFVIEPEVEIPGRAPASGAPVPAGFRYSSESNEDWLGIDAISELLPD